MSTSLILLDQNFNANDVDIMVFEPCVLFPLGPLGGIRQMVQLGNMITHKTSSRLGFLEDFVYFA